LVCEALDELDELDLVWETLDDDLVWLTDCETLLEDLVCEVDELDSPVIILYVHRKPTKSTPPPPPSGNVNLTSGVSSTTKLSVALNQNSAIPHMF